MLRNPKFWLYAAGGWLLLSGVTHGVMHTWSFALENGVAGMREFAINQMKQTQSFDPLQPSLWGQFRTFSVSFGLLLVFAGAVDMLLAWAHAPVRFIRTFALFATLFWTAAFVPFAFLDPVIQAIVVAAVAVPLHGIAYLTADLSVQADEARPPSPARPDPGS